VLYICCMTAQPKSPEAKTPENPPPVDKKTPEHGGPKGPEPTRYGDWVINGKCVDF